MTLLVVGAVFVFSALAACGHCATYALAPAHVPELQQAYYLGFTPTPKLELEPEQTSLVGQVSQLQARAS